MMKNSKKTIEVKCERTIPASPGEVFDAWLDPNSRTIFLDTTGGTPKMCEPANRRT